MKRISIKRLKELQEQEARIAPLMNEHDIRITQLMNELHEYALRHGYSDEDLYEAAYTFTVETLGLMSKREAREILRKLEEGGDGMREVFQLE